MSFSPGPFDRGNKKGQLPFKESGPANGLPSRRPPRDPYVCGYHLLSVASSFLLRFEIDAAFAANPRLIAPAASIFFRPSRRYGFLKMGGVQGALTKTAAAWIESLVAAVLIGTSGEF